MKAIVVTDQAAGSAGMKLVDRPEPQAAINDVVVEIHEHVVDASSARRSDGRGALQSLSCFHQIHE